LITIGNLDFLVVKLKKQNMYYYNCYCYCSSSSNCCCCCCYSSSTKVYYFIVFKSLNSSLSKHFQASQLIDADGIHSVVTKCCSTGHTKALHGLQQQPLLW